MHALLVKKKRVFFLSTPRLLFLCGYFFVASVSLAVADDAAPTSGDFTQSSASVTAVETQPLDDRRDAAFLPPNTAPASVPAPMAPVSPSVGAPMVGPIAPPAAITTAVPAAPPNPVAPSPAINPGPALIAPPGAAPPTLNTASTASSPTFSPTLPPVTASTSPAMPPPAPSTIPAKSDPGATVIMPIPPAAIAKPVEAAPLRDIDPQSVGLLSANDGGLGAAMWKGTPRAFIETFIPALVLPNASPALNNLARTFLLTTANVPSPPEIKTKNSTAPAGKSDAQFSSSISPPLNPLSARIEKLIALGDVSDAWRLAALAKADQLNDNTARILIENALGANLGDVCAQMPVITNAHKSSDWLQAAVVCEFRAKDTKAVQVSLDVMRTQIGKDETFYSIAQKNILNTNRQLPRQLTPIKPLTLALLQMTDLPLPGEIYAHPPAAVIQPLLSAKARDEDFRLALAERSAMQGILTTADLASVYTSISFPPDMISGAATNPGTDLPRIRALLYQAALQDKSEVGRLADATRFLQITDGHLLNGSAAKLLADMVKDIHAGTEFNTQSAVMLHIAMISGNADAAAEWYKQAHIAAIGIPDVSTALLPLWPLTVFSGLEPDGKFTADLHLWLDYILSFGDAHSAREEAAYVLLLMEASGYPIAPEDWTRVEDPPAFEKRNSPPALFIERLRDASVNGRRGEAVLTALLLAGTGMSLEATPLTTIEIVRALHAINLNGDAAALAREQVITLTATPLIKP